MIKKQHAKRTEKFWSAGDLIVLRGIQIFLDGRGTAPPWGMVPPHPPMLGSPNSYKTKLDPTGP